MESGISVLDKPEVFVCQRTNVRTHSHFFNLNKTQSIPHQALHPRLGEEITAINTHLILDLLRVFHQIVGKERSLSQLVTRVQSAIIIRHQQCGKPLTRPHKQSQSESLPQSPAQQVRPRRRNRLLSGVNATSWLLLNTQNQN